MEEMFYIDTFQYLFSLLNFLSKIWRSRRAILNDVTGLMPLVFGKKVINTKHIHSENHHT